MSRRQLQGLLQALDSPATGRANCLGRTDSRDDRGLPRRGTRGRSMRPYASVGQMGSLEGSRWHRTASMATPEAGLQLLPIDLGHGDEPETGFLRAHDRGEIRTLLQSPRTRPPHFVVTWPDDRRHSSRSKGFGSGRGLGVRGRQVAQSQSSGSRSIETDRRERSRCRLGGGSRGLGRGDAAASFALRTAPSPAGSGAAGAGRLSPHRPGPWPLPSSRHSPS